MSLYYSHKLRVGDSWGSPPTLDPTKEVVAEHWVLPRTGLELRAAKEYTCRSRRDRKPKGSGVEAFELKPILTINPEVWISFGVVRPFSPAREESPLSSFASPCPGGP